MRTGERLCTECKFCVCEDYGYSNYTTEGTTLACLKNANPPLDGLDADCDKSIAEIIRVAADCVHFVEGEGPRRDVDCEVTAHDYKDDPELYRLLLERWSE